MNIMIDLETMDTKPTAAIIAIGAVSFFDDMLGAEYYQQINLESAMSFGRTLSADTVIWWLKQSEEARSKFFDNDVAPTLQDILLHFSEWLHLTCPFRERKVWGNGASFDNVILRDSYEAYGIVTPWPWWNDRCYRTVKNAFPEIKMERTGTHHNALDDAKSQAIHLMRMINT